MRSHDIQSGNHMPGDPFQIDVLPHTPIGRAAFTAARPLIEQMLALGTYRALYEEARGASGEPFESRALRALNITTAVSAADIDRVPRSGPVIVAANHPHGVVDGLLLMAAVRRARPDIRVLANQLLARIPELCDCCLFVDPFDGPGAEARNRAGLRAAHVWLRRGGALIVFPAGEVAHARQTDGARADSPWKPAMGRLAVATGAHVVPAFIQGRNSRTFYAAGHVHRALRTILLPRELLKKRGSTIAVRLGEQLSPADLPKDAAGATARVRAAVDRLAATVRLKPDTTGTTPVPEAADATGTAPVPTESHASGSRDDGTTGAASADAISIDTISVVSGFSRARSIASEVDGLPTDARLVESGPFQVFCVGAGQIPATLREIGRLRALTYDAVGEGSGHTLDLDRFDDRYLHLFSWDREQRLVVGAYRIGQTDRIVAADSVDGLYTRTLFRYDERLIGRMAAPALELGRSFVRAEYQKNYNALLLLWKGIGRFIARHPQYRLLFGPVSISARYSDSSHQLLMSFLRQNHFAAEFSELVDALHPPRVRSARAASWCTPQTVDEVNRLVERADGTGMPVLLRQYLKLNARLIGFNVDPAFADALDALMIVDLAKVDPAILSRYLGRHETGQFLARHGVGRQASAAA